MRRLRCRSAWRGSPTIASSSPRTVMRRSSRHAGSGVHGVLWRLTPRDRVTLDAWENIAGGLYRAEILPVLEAGRLRPALVYVARRRPVGAAEGRLYGDRGQGRARVGNAGRLHGVLARVAADSGRSAPAIASLESSVERRTRLVRHPRPGAGRRLPRLDRSRRRSSAAVQGWVRNRRDGAVEALFSGLEDRRVGHDRGVPQRTARRARRFRRSSRGRPGRSWRCAGATNYSRCSAPPEHRSLRRTAARMRRATPCPLPASIRSGRGRRAR